MAVKRTKGATSVPLPPAEKKEKTENPLPAFPATAMHDFRASDSIVNLAKALGKWNDTIAGDRILFKTTQGYTANYVSLDQVWEHLDAHDLSAFNLALTAFPVGSSGRHYGVRIFLIHTTSGEFLSEVFYVETPANLQAANESQKAVAATTYAYRVAVGLILSIVSAKDTDGR